MTTRCGSRRSSGISRFWKAATASTPTAWSKPRIDESLERQRISNINVAETPTLNHEPTRPKALLTLVLGFAVGLFGGLCLALAVEYFDHSLKTSEEIERRLSLPVLASIPQMNGRHLVARM